MLFEQSENDEPNAEAQLCQVTEVAPEHILIIDDDQAQTEALAHCFRRQGYRTTVASSCAQGYATAKIERPDLILLDINLPDGSGLDACAAMTDDAEIADTPVLIVSGSDQPDVVRQARSAGCRFFVRKPCDPNALLTLVQSAIGEANLW